LATADLPAIISFVLPGFIALGILAGLGGPAKRTQVEWIGQSLLISLVVYWVVLGVRGGRSEGVERDPSFQAQLAGVAVLFGFVAHYALRVPVVGLWLEAFWSRTDPKIWDNFDLDDWVQVEVKSGEYIYGQVAGMSNDPNEDRLELYLEHVASLDPAVSRWEQLVGTTGVYVPGEQIVLVQLLDPMIGLEESTPERRGRGTRVRSPRS